MEGMEGQCIPKVMSPSEGHTAQMAAEAAAHTGVNLTPDETMEAAIRLNNATAAANAAEASRYQLALANPWAWRRR